MSRPFHVFMLKQLRKIWKLKFINKENIRILHKLFVLEKFLKFVSQKSKTCNILVNHLWHFICGLNEFNFSNSNIKFNIVKLLNSSTLFCMSHITKMNGSTVQFCLRYEDYKIKVRQYILLRPFVERKKGCLFIKKKIRSN